MCIITAEVSDGKGNAGNGSSWREWKEMPREHVIQDAFPQTKHCANSVLFLHSGIQSGPEKNAQSLTHRHFATGCSRISRFSL